MYSHDILLCLRRASLLADPINVLLRAVLHDDEEADHAYVQT